MNLIVNLLLFLFEKKLLIFLFICYQIFTLPRIIMINELIHINFNFEEINLGSLFMIHI